jgi:hypothetical protein
LEDLLQQNIITSKKHKQEMGEREEGAGWVGGWNVKHPKRNEVPSPMNKIEV